MLIHKLGSTPSNAIKGGKFGSVSAPGVKSEKEEQEDTAELIRELFDALSEGNHKVLARILSDSTNPGLLLAKKDLQGLTPLKKAITLNKPEVARILVKNGAKPSVIDPMGKTPLHIAVMQGRRELMAPLLVSADSSVNAQDKNGWTPLHYAIRGKHLKAMEWLLFAGADVTLKNKDDQSPLEAAEEDELMMKMLKAHDIDREVFPVDLSSAFIARKSLNTIGTDGILMFVTSQNWSPNEQFFFCKRVRPNEARPLIPLKWNECFYSDVFHYRTMRQLNFGETRVKIFILFFEEIKISEIVLKVTSKDRYLGEMPLTLSTYIQDKYTNFMGSCELDIKPEGQFVVVKRAMSTQLRKNEDGVFSCSKYPSFMIDMPQGAVPAPPKDWNNNREERARQEREQLVAKTKAMAEASSKYDFLEEFIKRTTSEEQVIETEPMAASEPPTIKLEPSTSMTEDLNEEFEIGMSGKMSRVTSEESIEVPLEPMLDVQVEDNCDDFYYISRGWGLFLTVIRSFDLYATMDLAAKEGTPLRCATNFYLIKHTSDQNPRYECLFQIPKTDNFARVGTVLVFARKPVAPNEEKPDPDESSLEYLLSDDMKTTWGNVWLNQEKDRWFLIDAGVANKTSRVVFKTKLFTAFIVVQLNSGTEKSEREQDDDESSDDEDAEEDSGSKMGDDEDKEEEKLAEEVADEEGAGGEDSEGSKKKGKKSKKRHHSATSELLELDDELCIEDLVEFEEEMIVAAEGEGEGEDTDQKVASSAATVPEAVMVTEETGEPGAPAPSPMVNKEEENKDENASNVTRPWDLVERSDANTNNNVIDQNIAGKNTNNNEIRDLDQMIDQSSLPPEERTIIVGPPPLPTSFARLPIAPSVYRVMKHPSSIMEETSDQVEAEETTTDEKSKDKTPSVAGPASVAPTYPSILEDTIMPSRSNIQENESEEDLPQVVQKKLSIAVIKNGVKKTQDFHFGPKLTNLPLEGVDMDQLKLEIAQMWRLRNHKQTRVLIFSKPRGDGTFDMIIDVVQSMNTYVRAEHHYSEGYKMVGESEPLAIRTGHTLSFNIEGPLIVEKCQGGITNSSGNPRTRSMYFAHSKINSLEYVVKRPQVEEVKGPTGKKGKKKEEVKVDHEPDARLEVVSFCAGSLANSVDLAAFAIWLTGPDLWNERHIQLRASDNKLLDLLIGCLSKSQTLARAWWRLLILLGYSEKDVETEKGKTPPPVIISTYLRRWFEDCLDHHDRGILGLIQALDTLKLDVAIDNVVRIIKLYKSHLLLKEDRPRYLMLLIHWVLQTKISRNSLLRLSETRIMRPVSDVFLLHVSDFLPKAELYKIGAAMDVEDNVLHAIAGEEIITEEAYLGFRVLIKSRQKKDEIIHYTLLLMEMFKQVELPEAHALMVRETKKWMETVAESDPEVCSKLDNVFA